MCEGLVYIDFLHMKLSLTEQNFLNWGVFYGY